MEIWIGSSSAEWSFNTWTVIGSHLQSNPIDCESLWRISESNHIIIIIVYSERLWISLYFWKDIQSKPLIMCSFRVDSDFLPLCTDFVFLYLDHFQNKNSSHPCSFCRYKEYFKYIVQHGYWKCTLSLPSDFREMYVVHVHCVVFP